VAEPLRLSAPAKLNLFLQIVGRRADGMHLLQTVFQLIDLCDGVELEDRADGKIVRVGGAEGVPAEQDLALRAAHLLKQAVGTRRGALVRVEKRIPMGAGLGGGSSDAAAVLLGLNRLWHCNLGVDALAELGLRLGADVPVFVRGRSAWAEGIGEQLSPMSLGDSSYVVLDSGVKVPTEELFQASELTRDAPPTTIAGFVSGRACGNAFEKVLAKRSAAVAESLSLLAQAAGAEALQVGLSGTGGCCFARFAQRGQAQAAAARLPGRLRHWIAQGIDQSPVLQQIEAVRVA
jgi:4-diphosphocytidyl-2-C-methyl-D-erythritol kinase